MQPATLNLATLQLNFRVGDPAFNAETLLKGYQAACKQGADFAVAPELAISGYPPKDNLLHTAFIRMCMRMAETVAASVGDVPLAFGTPWLADVPGDYGQKSLNSYVVAQNGKIVFRTDKRYPAQGGVFDEWRVHVQGVPRVFQWKGLAIGFPICEDIWHDSVVESLIQQGAELFLVPNGSPTYVGKPQVRWNLVQKHVTRTGKPMLYLNHVGGQDEHAFDGGAFFVNPDGGQPTVFAPYWTEAVALVKLTKNSLGWQFTSEKTIPLPDDDTYILDAVITATRDYLLKSASLRKVVIGISGGVDSAVVLGLAKLVLESAGLNPAENILAVSLPSRHNTETTKGFAQQVCDNLGIPLKWWPIGDAITGLNLSFEETFGEPLKASANVAYENTQSRERGQVLMAVSNRYGALLLSTGNKSEMAMGYATLYGDMNGGFNPLKTLYKTQVYRLGHAINARLGYQAIPAALIQQRPSAELDDNQFDENSLPPYPVLDAILARFIDDRLDVAEIVGGANAQVYDATIVFPVTNPWNEAVLPKAPFQRWTQENGTYTVHPTCVEAVAKQLLRMRFKRYQACPGVTITRSGFDDGEKYPLANGGGEWLAEGLENA